MRKEVNLRALVMARHWSRKPLARQTKGGGLAD
jgi:hypothetical protein